MIVTPLTRLRECVVLDHYLPILVPHCCPSGNSRVAEGPHRLRDFLQLHAGQYRANNNPFYRELHISSAETSISEFSSRKRKAAFDFGISPIFFGGDHSITLPIMKGVLGDIDGPFSLIVFDAHSDCHGDSEVIMNWNVLKHVRRFFGDKLEIIHLGYRDTDIDTLLLHVDHVFDSSAISIHGLSDTCSKVKKLIGGKPVYVSVDLDVIDPIFFSSVAAPISGGLSTMQLYSFFKSFSGENVVGCDLVEYLHFESGPVPFVTIADTLLHMTDMAKHENCFRSTD